MASTQWDGIGRDVLIVGVAVSTALLPDTVLGAVGGRYRAATPAPAAGTTSAAGYRASPSSRDETRLWSGR